MENGKSTAGLWESFLMTVLQLPPFVTGFHVKNSMMPFIQRIIFHLLQRGILLADTSMIWKLRWSKNIQIANIDFSGRMMSWFSASGMHGWNLMPVPKHIYSCNCSPIQLKKTNTHKKNNPPYLSKYILFGQ